MDKEFEKIILAELQKLVEIGDYKTWSGIWPMVTDEEVKLVQTFLDTIQDEKKFEAKKDLYHQGHYLSLLIERIV